MKTLSLLISLLSISAHADGVSLISAYLVEGGKINQPISSNAISEYTPVDVTSLNHRIVGKGVEARITHEGLAFACVGAPVDSETQADCHFVRALYYQPTDQKIIAFGAVYVVKDLDFKSFFRSLKSSSTQSAPGGGSITNTYNEYLAFYSEEISDQKGWNWSSRPEKIAYGRFLSMVEDCEGAYAMFAKMDSKKVFSQMIQPHGTPGFFSPMNKWMVPHFNN